ncbi:cyclopropane-fatty-acyl-phospholipid synthase [Coprinopsis cinerea okayama7|uniref:Cyclopropane-fatty-acyl-phospholipid synthase n=1 Tax=Coprinopsis cinerea (strain Okayama-7 / 130 / ATCC MYA-4618 / FGSC 9003) TaxID=240176 RepID=A8NSP0_COPC7|nr:cyclopropane-fatty-acyl-phospholipid synthase [Coprinopsis cinerea okayama7\|eukprot:XP_001836055.2 cyclopropane-fatty-acyl-phospholipid synthase [Coprinopsis cinerea okayama7\
MSSQQLLSTPAQHPFSLPGLADKLWSTLMEGAISRVGWGAVVRLAEGGVTELLKRIQIGELTIHTPSTTYTFPEPSHERDRQLEPGQHEHEHPTATLRVLKDTFWLRLCLTGDLGFAESYMYGEVDVEGGAEGLIEVFKIFLANKPHLSTLNDSYLASLFTSIPQKLTSWRFVNSLSNSRSNISAHYDISNEMFAGFLSKDMVYSCAIFPDLDADLRSPHRHIRQPLTKPSNSRTTLPGIKGEVLAGSHFPPSPPLTDQEPSISTSPSRSDQAPETPGRGTADLVKETCERLGATSHAQAGSAAPSDDHSARDVDQDNNNDSEEEEDNDPLHQAQLRKLDYIITKLRIPDSNHDGSSQQPIRVLEIGGGWGELAIRLCERYPHVWVDSLTLSSSQLELAQERVREASLRDFERRRQRRRSSESPSPSSQHQHQHQDQDQELPPYTPLSTRITFHLLDYRALPPHWSSSFDRIVSIEMVEAVGEHFMSTYFQTIDWALKPLTGVGVVQGITIPEGRWERYKSEVDFIRKWIFPGGHLPSLTYLLTSLSQGSQSRLTVDSITNIGPHYARTLREWRRRFESRFSSVIRPALEREYPDVMGKEEEVEVFRRKWICECYCF